MKLTKAIEIVQHHGVTDDGATWQDYLDAVKLLIEAGKLIDYCRSGNYDPPFELLPGETEE